MCRGVLLSSPRQQTRSQRLPAQCTTQACCRGVGLKQPEKRNLNSHKSPAGVTVTLNTPLRPTFKMSLKKTKPHTHTHTHTLWHTSLKLYHLKHFKVRRATEFFLLFLSFFFSFASQKGIKQWCWCSNGGRVQLLNRSRRPCDAAQHLHSGYCPKAAS